MSFHLHLSASGQSLDLTPGSAFTLNLNCPIFDPQRTDRAWAFPLTIERTPRNELALSANRADGVAVGMKVEAILYIAGIPYETGTLKVTKLTPKRITVNFANLAIDFAERASAVKLRDLDLTVTVAAPFAPVVQLEARRNSPIGIFKLWIRINGIDYITAYNVPATFVANINADHPGLITLVEDSTAAHRFTLNNIPGIRELEIDFIPGNDYDDATNTTFIFPALLDLNYQQEANRIVAAYNNLDTEAEASAFRLPTIAVPSFYDDKNPEFGGIMNRYDSAAGGYVFQPFHSLDEELSWEDALLPQPRVVSLLEAALQEMGYRLRGSLALDQELRQILIWNNHDLNVRLYDLGPATPGLFVSTELYLENSFIVPRPTFNLADHAPDLTALQLVLLFAETFAHVITAEADQVTLTPIRELLQAAPEDWTDKIDTDYTATFADATTPVLDYDRQGDENIFPGQLERSTLPGTGVQRPYVLPVFSTFEQVRDEQGVRLRLPIIAEEGRNESLDLGNEPSLRFFFHRGIQPAGTPGQTFPQAGHSRQGFAGVVGSYSMNWLGDGGLYETWWREIIELSSYDRTLTVVCRLTITDLLEIRKWRDVRKYLRIPDGTFVGVISSVRVKITDRTIELATVTFQLEPS